MKLRKCSLCGEYYTDETGHDPKKCVETLEKRVISLRKDLADAERALAEAKRRLRGKP